MEKETNNNYKLVTKSWQELIDIKCLDYSVDTLIKAFYHEGLHKYIAIEKKVYSILRYKDSLLIHI